MDKIIVTNNDLEFLLKWRDEHKDLVRMTVNPLRAVKIICQESGVILTAINDSGRLRIGITQNGRSKGNVEFERTVNGMYKIVKDKTDLSDENKQSVLTCYASVMAFIVFGNGTVELPDIKERNTDSTHKKASKKPKKKKQNGITYIITYSSKQPHLAIKGSHSSPHCIFSVRGHFRRYKNGKVVWIAQYTKGTGKKKDKSYKIGRTE